LYKCFENIFLVKQFATKRLRKQIVKDVDKEKMNGNGEEKEKGKGKENLSTIINE
jgi:hypothetical protein